MSKTFRNHIIFAVLAAIVFVVSVAIFMSNLYSSTVGDWILDLYFQSFLLANLKLYAPLFFAAESMVYALKFIIEISLCYKKTKLVRGLNVANILAGTLILVSYVLKFRERRIPDAAYFAISYTCVAVIAAVAIASIVVLVLNAKKAKTENA